MDEETPTTDESDVTMTTRRPSSVSSNGDCVIEMEDEEVSGVGDNREEFESVGGHIATTSLENGIDDVTKNDGTLQGASASSSETHSNEQTISVPSTSLSPPPFPSSGSDLSNDADVKTLDATPRESPRESPDVQIIDYEDR